MPTQTKTAPASASAACARSRSRIGPLKSTSSSIANEPNAANVADRRVPDHLDAEREHRRHHDRGAPGAAQREQVAVARAHPPEQTRQAGEAHAQIMTTRRCSSKTTNQYDPYRTVLGGESAVP